MAVERIPQALIESTAEGRTVLFAGAGLSQPQLPGWKKLLEGMLDPQFEAAELVGPAADRSSGWPPGVFQRIVQCLPLTS